MDRAVVYVINMQNIAINVVAILVIVMSLCVIYVGNQILYVVVLVKYVASVVKWKQIANALTTNLMKLYVKIVEDIMLKAIVNIHVLHVVNS